MPKNDPNKSTKDAELQRLVEENQRLLRSRATANPEPQQSGPSAVSDEIRNAQEATRRAFDHLSTSVQQSFLDTSDDLDLQAAMANRPSLTVAPYFSDKIESSITRLKGDNWAIWKWQLSNVLDAKGLTDVLDSDDPRGSPREVAARQIISSSLDASLVSKVVHCTTAQQIWSCLRGIYENRTSFALTDMIGRMNSYRMNSLNDVEAGVSEIQSIACQIKALGGSADDSTIESAILRALPKSFSSFITSWTFLDAEKRTLDNLHAHLMRTICQLRLDEPSSSKDKALFAQNRNQSDKSNFKDRHVPKKDKSKPDTPKLFCKYCKKKNHKVEDCRKLQRKKESESSPPSKPDDNSAPPKPDKPQVDDQAAARVAYGHVATLEPGREQRKCFLATNPDGIYVQTTWLADSGASFHMTSHLEWLAGYEELFSPLSVKMGDNFALQAVGRGFIETSNGLIDPVYYLPKITENLFSTSFCAKYHKIFSTNTDRDIRFFRESNRSEELFRGHLNECGVYELKLTVKLAKHVAFASQSLTKWHERLGHVSVDIVKHMARNNIVEGLNISEVRKDRCEPCIYGKQTKASHPERSTPRSQKAGEILHFDTVGPMPEESLGGARYYVLCKDSYSNFRQVFFVSSKSMIPSEVKKMIHKAELQTGNDCKQLQSDNGSEFLNAELASFLNQKGIIHQTSATYTAEQNGFIERDIRTVAEMARTMRVSASLPKPYWAEAIATAVYTLNRVVNSSNKEATPYQLWFGRKPSLKNLHRFGESAIVYVEKHQRDKLDPKGEKLTFVGYTEVSNTYRFIEPQSGHLVISCNAVFVNTTNNLPDQSDTSSTDESLADDDLLFFSSTQVQPVFESVEPQSVSDDGVTSACEPDNISGYGTPIETPANRSFELEQTEQGEEGDAGFEQSKQLYHPYQRLEREEPATMPPEMVDSERLATLRPRTQRPLYTGWKANLTVYAAENPPTTIAEAKKRHDWDMWKKAIDDEYNSLVHNDVFELVEPPHNQRVKLMSSRWVFVQKKDGRYKARLVARGYEQIEGIHFFETYAPTPNMEDIRLLFSYAAVHNLRIAQFDIKTAFLNGDLDVVIYMRQPEPFETNDNRVWRLKKSLYGLRQSPRQWSRKFTAFLLEIGLVESSDNHCIFYKLNPMVMLAIYVDDGLVFAEQQKEVDHVLHQLRSRFDVHTMELATFLGFQIERPRDHQIILHQHDYIQKVLRTFGADQANEQPSPISPCKLTPDDTPLEPGNMYRQMVGSLLYAAITTRVDIAFAVHKASRALSNPTQSDLQLVKRIMRYLNGTRSFGLSYSLEQHRGFEVYTDSDHAGCDETSRSTTGSIVMFAGAPVHWRSSRQTSVTRSSTEAEIVALDQTVVDAKRVASLAFEIGLVKRQPLLIQCDNMSAIHLVSDDRACHKNKFQKIKCAFIREQVLDGAIRLTHVRSENNLADSLTKPIAIKSFIKARDTMMTNTTVKVALLALTAMFMASCLTAIKFDTTRPIIYERTEHYVDDGDVEYIVDLTYDNPSALLETFLPSRRLVNPTANAVPLVDPNEERFVQSYIDEANKMYASTWLVKMEELANVVIPKPIEDSYPTGHTIEKRDVTGTVVMGTCVYNFLSSIFAPYLPWSEYAKVKRLEEFQQQEQHRLEQFRQQFNATRSIELGLLDMAHQNARSIRDLKKQLSFFAEMSQQLTWLTTLIQTRISFATSDLKVVITEAQHGRVATHEIADLFNLTDLRQIEPQDTSLISVQRIASQTIRFRFFVNQHSKDTSIYRVHAFRYWANLTGRPELREYQGNSFIMLNRTANCIRGIQQPVERTIADRCSTRDYSDPKVSVWRTLISDYNVEAQDTTNVLKTSFYNYIYCFPSNITVYSHTVPCPTQVFRLTLNTPFSSGTYVHEYTQRKMFGHMENKFVETIHLAHFNGTAVATPEVEMFHKLRSLIQANIQREEDSKTEWRVSKQSPALWVMATFIMLMSLAIAGLIIHIRRGHSKLSRHQKEVKHELGLLSSNYATYQKMECAGCSHAVRQLREANSKLLQSMTSVTSVSKPIEVGRNDSVNFHIHAAPGAEGSTGTKVVKL